ncbi:MAG: shikimate kinase [Verrucomicrobia bacterium]|nr:shikimate kinase [Verrucomicrobiota bacterium]
MAKKNIILVGFMGTGKTVTGRVLAERTGLELVDMDSLIEARQGKTIPEIFATDGEPAFRAMERELVQELAQRDGLIISTGGGIVLNPDNIADFEKTGLVVCLKASPEMVFQRLEKDASRPLLAGDKKTQIASILETRSPFYDAIAHGIDTDGLTAEETAEPILALYALES